MKIKAPLSLYSISDINCRALSVPLFLSNWLGYMEKPFTGANLITVDGTKSKTAASTTEEMVTSKLPAKWLCVAVEAQIELHFTIVYNGELKYTNRSMLLRHLPQNVIESLLRKKLQRLFKTTGHAWAQPPAYSWVYLLCEKHTVLLYYLVHIVSLYQNML